MGSAIRVVRRFLAGKAENDLEKIRKGKGSTLQMGPLLGVLEHLGFKTDMAGAEVLINSPDGSSYTGEFTLKPPPALWAWVKSQPTFQKAVESEAASALSVGQTRTEGTCPCCFKRQKLKDEKMVMHGYKAPGLGSGFQGRCFGVGYPPFEVSPNGTEAYRQEMLAEAKRAEAVVDQIRRGDVAELPHPLYGTRKLRREDATPAEWARAIDHAIPLAQRQVELYEREAEKLQQVIDRWKPQPLQEPHPLHVEGPEPGATLAVDLFVDGRTRLAVLGDGGGPGEGLIVVGGAEAEGLVGGVEEVGGPGALGGDEGGLLGPGDFELPHVALIHRKKDRRGRSFRCRVGIGVGDHGLHLHQSAPSQNGVGRPDRPSRSVEPCAGDSGAKDANP